MHLTNAMRRKTCSSDPDLTQRGKFMGREVQCLNYIMSTVFSYFPYQYQSMLNKDFFCIEKLFFLIPNQNYLSKHIRYSLIWGNYVSLSASAWPLQTLLCLCKPSPLQTLLCLFKPSSSSTNPGCSKPSSAWPPVPAPPGFPFCFSQCKRGWENQHSSIVLWHEIWKLHILYPCLTGRICTMQKTHFKILVGVLFKIHICYVDV